VHPAHPDTETAAAVDRIDDQLGRDMLGFAAASTAELLLSDRVKVPPFVMIPCTAAAGRLALLQACSTRLIQHRSARLLQGPSATVSENRERMRHRGAFPSCTVMMTVF